MSRQKEYIQDVERHLPKYLKDRQDILDEVSQFAEESGEDDSAFEEAFGSPKHFVKRIMRAKYGWLWSPGRVFILIGFMVFVFGALSTYSLSGDLFSVDDALAFQLSKLSLPFFLLVWAFSIAQLRKLIRSSLMRLTILFILYHLSYGLAWFFAALAGFADVYFHDFVDVIGQLVGTILYPQFFFISLVISVLWSIAQRPKERFTIRSVVALIDGLILFAIWWVISIADIDYPTTLSYADQSFVTADLIGVVLAMLWFRNHKRLFMRVFTVHSHRST